MDKSHVQNAIVQKTIIRQDEVAIMSYIAKPCNDLRFCRQIYFIDVGLLFVHIKLDIFGINGE